MKTKSNGALKIESGIPVPEHYGKGNYRGVSGTLRKLKVGQSVLLEQYENTHTPSRLAHQVKKATGFVFVCRAVEGGVRVWRAS